VPEWLEVALLVLFISGAACGVWLNWEAQKAPHDRMGDYGEDDWHV